MHRVSEKMPRILELPEELVVNIAGRLDSDNKSSLRLTCRALEQRSLHAFGSDHFTKKCVHLTTDSLAVLVNISRSEKLGRYVRSVTLITALFSELAVARTGLACRNGLIWKPNGHEEGAYKFYVEDQSALRRTGREEAMLAKSFYLLPRLNTVALIDSEDRLEPGTDYQGGRKVLRKTGTRALSGSLISRASPNEWHDRPDEWRDLSDDLADHFDHLWNIALQALPSSRSIREFRTDCASYTNFVTPNHFGFGDYVRMRLQPVFGAMTRIELNLTDVVSGGAGDGEGSDALLPDWEKDHIDLSHFASTLTSLDSLRLCFDDAYVANDLICLSLLTHIDTSKLKDLHLIGLSLDASSLVSILASLERVADLRLEAIDLIGGVWSEAFQIISRYQELEHLDLVHVRESGLPGYFAKSSTDNPENTYASLQDPRHTYTSYANLSAADGDSDRLQIRDEAELGPVLANPRGRLPEYIGLAMYLSPRVCIKGPNIRKGLDMLWRSYVTKPELPLPAEYQVRLVTSDDALADLQLQGWTGERDGSEDFTEFVVQSIEDAHEFHPPAS